MRFKSQALLVAVLTAFAVSFVASASASAAECPGTEKGVALCVQGKGTVGEVTFTSKLSKGTESILHSGFGEMLCSTVSGKGAFQPVASAEAIKIANLTLTFSGCRMTGAQASCHVKSFAFENLSGETTESNLKYFPSEGKTVFGTFELAECANDGDYRITDEKAGVGPVCSIVHANEEAIEHELECPKTGSHLRWAGEEVTLLMNERVALSGATLGKKWSVQKG